MLGKFIKKRPVISFSLLATVSLALGVVVTQVQANIQSSSVLEKNNPHLLPDNLNPKLHWEEQKMIVSKNANQNDLFNESNDVADNAMEESSTIHSIAMKDNKSTPKPVYDYTTGTSN
jgi:signal recognition particle subunit SEC65